MDIPQELKQILTDTPELQQAYLVGGCVRDGILGSSQKDFDIEVYGLSYEQLQRVLSRWGRPDLVGRSFGVIKLTTPAGTTYDFSLPRRDSKTASGHKGFEIHIDPSIQPEEAASRRDFTINALMLDVRSGRVLDFFGGERDLHHRVLRHVGPAFPEDPLRVLRGMQFAGRFNLTATDETLALCRSIAHTYRELALERVREEWFKWARLSIMPSAGLRFLRDSGWCVHFPELAALIGVPQDPEWHPEGDVWAHSLHACDAMAGLEAWKQADDESRTVWMLTALCHDLGKAETTHEEMKNGRLRIVSPGHSENGAVLAKSFLGRMDTPETIVHRVTPLIIDHLVHINPLSDRGVRRLAARLDPETINGLIQVITADHSGRPPKPGGLPESARQLLERSQELKISQRPPAAILMGRHLLERGVAPGPGMGEILHAAHEAQLDGAFNDLEGALGWLRNFLNSRSAGGPLGP
jgi:tRNA nucleotidyltransferase (CCA-adding enzyme)